MDIRKAFLRFQFVESVFVAFVYFSFGPWSITERSFALDLQEEGEEYFFIEMTNKKNIRTIRSLYKMINLDFALRTRRSTNYKHQLLRSDLEQGSRNPSSGGNIENFYNEWTSSRFLGTCDRQWCQRCFCVPWKRVEIDEGGGWRTSYSWTSHERSCEQNGHGNASVRASIRFCFGGGFRFDLRLPIVERRKTTDGRLKYERD